MGIIDSIIYQNILLEGQKERIAQETLKKLSDMYFEIKLVIESYNNKNMAVILNKIKDLINKYYNDFDDDLKNQLKELGIVHQEFQNEVYKKYEEETNINVVLLSLTSKEMLEKTSGVSVVGKTINETVNQSKVKLFNDVKAIAKFGFMNNQDFSEINQLIKTKTNIEIRNMNNFIATATKSAISEIEENISKKNKELSEYEIYLAVLDNKTSKLCRSLNGKIFKKGEGQQTPAHHNCRSLRITYFKDLDVDYKNYNDFINKSKKTGLKSTESGAMERGNVPKYSLNTYKEKIMKDIKES